MIDILVVEDNRELCELLCDFLRAENYMVSCADSGEKALTFYEKYGARLILLDINLPGMDGFEVCRRLRESDNTPVLILTARIDKEDKMNGLVIGADDYIEKPFDIDILIAKIKGIFKRRLALDFISDGDITLDLINQTVTKKGVPVVVTAKEFELLRMLIENRGHTLSKELLFKKCWGIDSESELQTLTVHIKWLRQKLEDDPKAPQKILTVWGKGYRWEVCDEKL